MEEAAAARIAALNLLARREHASLEIRQKLVARGFSQDLAGSIVQALMGEGLLSDERFTESYVRSRSARGYGPVRIRAELRERDVGDEALIGAVMGEFDWSELADAVRRKRFGTRLPSEWKERARQMRFLQYRGFAPEHIRTLMEGAGDE